MHKLPEGLISQNSIRGYASSLLNDNSFTDWMAGRSVKYPLDVTRNGMQADHLEKIPDLAHILTAWR